MLYFGLRLPEELKGKAEHCPLIETVPLPCDYAEEASSATHLLLTSRTTVDLLPKRLLKKGCQILCVGEGTAKSCTERGAIVSAVAGQETAEGMIALLEAIDLTNAYIFWPHSALSRPVLSQYLQARGIRFLEAILYTTRTLKPDPLPDLTRHDQWVFTSPSTVDAFIEMFGFCPDPERAVCIGPVTKEHLLCPRINQL